MILYHTDLKFRDVDAAQPTQILPNALLNERKTHPESKTYHITKNLHPASRCSTAI